MPEHKIEPGNASFYKAEEQSKQPEEDESEQVRGFETGRIEYRGTGCPDQLRLQYHLG